MATGNSAGIDFVSDLTFIGRPRPEQPPPSLLKQQAPPSLSESMLQRRHQNQSASMTRSASRPR
ncbi:hypothetical protein TIFTF001_021799 [Ficus carica]|uniref:Uncharacterized protein n=1 Tax=Ficus carica TaxID=3494 RepID=A0AA88AI54_FICCA|nr:hypothetical protein TIFTF001_021799 [Ficus carica]